MKKRLVTASLASEQVRDLVGDAGPREAGHLVCRYVHEHIEYLTGSTNVKTNAMQAWTTGKGVCQDISHVTVGLLRALGLPAGGLRRAG